MFLPNWAHAWISILAVLALWELSVRTGILDERYFPTMTATFAQLVRIIQTGEFWQALYNTLQGWAFGSVSQRCWRRRPGS